MRKLIYEEPIVPVFIDRDNELQSYYSGVEALIKKAAYPPYSNPNATAPGYYPPPNQYQPMPQWQGYGYPPQPPGAGGQPTGYPQVTSQPAYPGYAPNPGYPAYPQTGGYGPPQPNQYAPYTGYPGYGQPAAPMPQGQAAWSGYNQSYGGYGQPPAAPTPYQQAYPSYPSYNYPSPVAPPNQGEVRRVHAPSEHSAGPDSQTESPKESSQSHAGFGWSEALFSDLNSYSREVERAPQSASNDGRIPVQEMVTTSHSSSDCVYDYTKQFEQMRIGWNI